MQGFNGFTVTFGGRLNRGYLAGSQLFGQIFRIRSRSTASIPLLRTGDSWYSTEVTFGRVAMATMAKLATIDKVDLRRVWPKEATDFTPWLEENISVLGAALGMDLEVQAREAPVGAYLLDLLASDGRGRTVVIENQLGSTDHSHLGQLLTYMAGFDANVIVWIAKKFPGRTRRSARPAQQAHRGRHRVLRNRG